MESIVLKILLFIAIGSMFFGVSYFYIQESAPVCQSYVDEAFIVNRTCECQGFEYPRKQLEEDGSGRRETVCLGRIKSISCEQKQVSDTFEVPCPESEGELE